MYSNKDWVKDLVIYQVYPRSFQDSDGDGIGDIPGIISRLDYLKELGINAVWLSPVYRSPNDDNGYDISGYKEINPEFGTMQDWERLCDECHKRGMKVIMDLVVNHSSDEHPWFMESRTSKDNPKSDYYIWRDPKNGKEPNNWASVFGGSAWEYVPERGQYYYHLFSKKQPDLNWDNPELREEIYSMMKWWAEKGLDGFRVDAISYLDKPQDFPDSKLPPNPDGYSFSSDIVPGRPDTHAYIHEMNEKVFSPYNMVTVGEVIADETEELCRYVASEREEFDMAIPFVAPVIEINTWSPKKLREDISASYSALQQNGWWARFFSNHDKPRQVSLYGNDKEYREVSAKMLAIFLHSLPGTPFVYQGEEIGMTNMYFESIDDYDDLDAKNTYNMQILSGATPEEALKEAQMLSRDNARTPMQWSATENAGFTTGKPWLGINPNYSEINAENQINDPHSVFSTYKTLIALRKNCKAISRGSMEIADSVSENLFIIKRSYGNEILLAVCNFSDENISVDSGIIPDSYELLVSSYDREGNINLTNLRPYEAALLRIK
ncbi:MAG: alpha-glucosidase [Clostridia bacterium]|nr:alpha-glucosidase [Clostridia bacterium]